MEKCCECKTYVWPWQHSSLAGGAIHAECHQKIVTKAAADPVMRELMLCELDWFQRASGIKSNVTVA